MSAWPPPPPDDQFRKVWVAFAAATVVVLAVLGLVALLVHLIS